MEKLIKLKDYRQNRSADAKNEDKKPVPSTGAEILLFTGIQVEYKDETLPEPSPSPFAKRR